MKIGDGFFISAEKIWYNQIRNKNERGNSKAPEERVYDFGSSDIAKSGTPTTSFSCTSAHLGGSSQTMFSLEEVEQILE